MMPPAAQVAVHEDPLRAEALFRRDSDKHNRAVDAMFLWVLLADQAFAVVLAFVSSPYSWEGGERAIHIHVGLAVLFGLTINAFPIWSIRFRPGALATRISISIAQGLWSGLLIHLSDGRIETHFHIFGSLAMLAFYRDWRILLPATLVIASDHFLRGVYLPESIFGTQLLEKWRFLEHIAWVLFEDIFLVVGGLRGTREMRTAAAREARAEAANRIIAEASLLTERKVVERTLELEESREQYRLIAEGTDAIPFAFNLADNVFTYVGPQAERVFGWALEEWLRPEFIQRFLPRDQESALRRLLEKAEIGERLQFECQANSNKGHRLVLRLIMNIRDDRGTPSLMGLVLDITSLRNLESELRQAQKLESVGRLAAGVAHEINTPVQFVSDSIHFVRKGLGDLLHLLTGYQELESAIHTGTVAPDQAAALADEREEIDLPYLVQHLPGALDRSLEGLTRVADIVSSMKQFAHPDQKVMVFVDLNRAVESTLTIARGEYKTIADVETSFGPIPLVSCHGGEINQVLLNIIVNASHAIEDVVRGTERKGKIRIETAEEGDGVRISISDTGGGIPPSIREQIFDPFFTTKEVGKGTGQGLSIARSVVQEKHGGTLTFSTEMGAGTTFHIRLPREPASPRQSGSAPMSLLG